MKLEKVLVLDVLFYEVLFTIVLICFGIWTVANIINLLVRSSLATVIVSFEEQVSIVENEDLKEDDLMAYVIIILILENSEEHYDDATVVTFQERILLVSVLD